MYKKVKSLVFPYLFFSIPLFLFKGVYEAVKRQDLSQIDFFYPDTYLLGTEWFLIVLFICMFEFLLLNSIWKRLTKFLVVVLLFAMCYYASSNNLVSSESYLTMAGITLPFLYIGMKYKGIKEIFVRFSWLLACLSFAIIVVLAKLGVGISIPTLQVPENVLVYILASVTGFVFLISFSHILVKAETKFGWFQVIIKPLAFLGYYSLFVFILHWIFIKTFYYSIIMPKFPGDIASVVCAMSFAAITAVMGLYLKKIKFVFQ